MQITQENINWLKRGAYLQSLYDGSYVHEESNPNFKYIKDRFFRYETIDTAKQLNVST